MKIEKISWDQETVDHIFNYAVSPEEVEEVLFNDMDLPIIMRGKEGRYLSYGKTNGGRFLFVAWAFKNRKTKIITARNMTKKVRDIGRLNSYVKQADALSTPLAPNVAMFSRHQNLYLIPSPTALYPVHRTGRTIGSVVKAPH